MRLVTAIKASTTSEFVLIRLNHNTTQQFNVMKDELIKLAPNYKEICKNPPTNWVSVNPTEI